MANRYQPKYYIKNELGKVTRWAITRLKCPYGNKDFKTDFQYNIHGIFPDNDYLMCSACGFMQIQHVTYYSND